MFFLTPRHVKHGRQFVKDARKLLAYKSDEWSGDVVGDVERDIAELQTAVQGGKKDEIEKTAQKLDALLAKHLPPNHNNWLKENVEVFLVAIVVALGVRTYFLQPFTIPTGSMQPTLNGIVFHPTKEEPPNILSRVVSGGIYGREYVNIVAQERERVVGMSEVKSPLPFISRVPRMGGIFTRTEIATESESGQRRTYIIQQASETVKSQFFSKLDPSKIYAPGESIMRGYFDAGDHVFVDKVSYHFRKPRRGETFVFSTANIPGIKADPSTYYIKRLGGVPGDTLQIRPPELFVNGQRAQEPGFQRVMSGTREQSTNGYRGYGNWAEQKGYDQQVFQSRMTYLNQPQAIFKVPAKEYFALGDNSYNSFDSRGWGTVPEKNIMGYALIVYWPFWPHFGLSK